MPDAATVGLIGTALGGVIGGSAGWLNGLAQANRDRRREERAVQRAAYVDVLHSISATIDVMGEVAARLNISATRNNGIPQMESTEREHRLEEVRRSSDVLRRAVIAARLAAPNEVRDRIGARVRELEPLRKEVILSSPISEKKGRLGT
jgi:hypothetical protein